MKFFNSIFLLCLLFNLTKAKLPSTIPICGRYDPKISDCILRSVKTIQPRLASGNLGSGLQIPSLEPLLIKFLTYGNERNLKVTITNLLVHGSSNFRIDKLRTNINDLKFDFIITFPRLNVKGNYNFVLSLLGAPLSSQGEIFGTIDEPKARVGLKAYKYLQNGQEYIKVEPIRINIQRGSIKSLKLTNLFGGSPVIGEIVNSLLVSNSEYLINDVYPHIETNLSELFTNIANRILIEATFDELFPY
ncbi:hypothetical protein PVAND_014688 [Polypedilum vanderplanki]|uniref:Hemolymph juvenile hormone binding protein n=1 Tax=Polypedilum vanderplanki TaxID=319348 RepID=A0A9J6B9W6_POLVA|nr:hypothetical protein PVAND_014688 [Polypedilum vanderplanki]